MANMLKTARKARKAENKPGSRWALANRTKKVKSVTRRAGKTGKCDIGKAKKRLSVT